MVSGLVGTGLFSLNKVSSKPRNSGVDGTKRHFSDSNALEGAEAGCLLRGKDFTVYLRRAKVFVQFQQEFLSKLDQISAILRSWPDVKQPFRLKQIVSLKIV